MNFLMLLLVAGGGCFAIAWTVHYIPLIAQVGNKSISPRLWFCKLLGPFDAGITIILICGSWVGLSTAALGIQMMVYNVCTGLGLSMGVLIIKRWLVPRWTRQFEILCEQKELNN